jgi:type I restriction enzyme S subunit
MSFPTYAHYKDSGVEWLGEVPAHWDLKPLKHLVDFRSGGTPDKTNREFWDGEVPWASAKDLKTDELFDTIDHITETAVSAGAASLVEPGSILVVVRGMILARLFPVVTARVPMAINQDLKALSVKPHIHPDFMAWMLRGSEAETLRRLDEAGHGTKALRMDAWGAMRLPVPYLSEQVRIVDFLKVETTKLDALITEQRTLIDLLKEKRQAVISHAVTKGLDPRVPMKDSGVEWLGEVPAHWSLGGLTRFIGPVVDYRGRTPTKVDDGVFLVTARNIKGGVIDCSLSEEYVDPESAASLLERGKPEIGDVLFTMEAPLGQAALIDRDDIALAQRIVKFRGKENVAIGSFLVYWIMSHGCQARLLTLATGSTAIGIKSSKLGQIEFLAPPVDEQARISRHIATETSRMDVLIVEAETAISLLQERRSALISAAVTGKIDVRQAA